MSINTIKLKPANGLFPGNADFIIITIIYTILLFWGVWVGVRQAFQGMRSL
jgi:hypothetical protein